MPLFRGSGYMEQSIIETLTHAPADSFTVGAKLRLQWELLRTRWSLNRGGILRTPRAWFRARKQLYQA